MSRIESGKTTLNIDKMNLPQQIQMCIRDRTKSMRDSFSAMGTNTLSVSIWGYGSRTASVDDVYDLSLIHI